MQGARIALTENRRCCESSDNGGIYREGKQQYCDTTIDNYKAKHPVKIENVRRITIYVGYLQVPADDL